MSICELLLYFLIKVNSKRCIDKIEGEASSPNIGDTQNSIEDSSGEYPLKPKERKREKVKYIRWVPPLVGWTMLGTDGASKGTLGMAGAGGLLRDSLGNFQVKNASCQLILYYNTALHRSAKNRSC